MRAHVEEAMRAGAFSTSTGLVYPTGCFAGTDEIVALAEVAARGTAQADVREPHPR